MRALEHKVPPPVVGALMAAAMWALSSLAPPLALPTSVGGPLIVVLVIAGVTFDLLGLIAFLRMKTTINPLQPDRKSTRLNSSHIPLSRMPSSA